MPNSRWPAGQGVGRLAGCLSRPMTSAPSRSPCPRPSCTSISRARSSRSSCSSWPGATTSPSRSAGSRTLAPPIASPTCSPSSTSTTRRARCCAPRRTSTTSPAHTWTGRRPRRPPRRDLLRPPDPHGSRHPARDRGRRPARAPARTARRLGITSQLILCFLRHLPEDRRRSPTLDEAAALRGIVHRRGAGLLRVRPPAGAVRRRLRAGRAPRACTRRRPRRRGRSARLHLAGATTSGAERIDHGVRCLDDDRLVRRLARER